MKATAAEILARRRAEQEAKRATFPFATRIGDELRQHFPKASVTYAAEAGRTVGTQGDPGVIATVPFTPARGPNRDKGPSSSRTQGAGPVASPPDLGGRE